MSCSLNAPVLYEGHSEPSFNPRFEKKWNHLCSHTDPGYSLDYTGCEKVDEDAAYLLLAVKEAARVMLGSLLVKLVGESMLPVLWEPEWREKTLG